MDARITKSRLANLISYDWIKILVAIAAAVVALCVFFTTVKTRPRDNQEFSVFAYLDLETGSESSTFAATLKSANVFSYDILKVSAESFGSNMYASATFTARRAANEGTVMFVGNHVEDSSAESEEKGTLQSLVEGYISPTSTNSGTLQMFLETDDFMNRAAAYIANFYGESWREDSAVLDETKAADCFYARNGKDKRFKTKTAKAKGVEQEKERLTQLREDLLFVEHAFENGILAHKVISTEYGDFTVGISVAKLTRLSNVYYYNETREEGQVRSIEEMYLTLFNNGKSMGDLEFETVSFLRYLVETYYTGDLS